LNAVLLYLFKLKQTSRQASVVPVVACFLQFGVDNQTGKRCCSFGANPSRQTDSVTSADEHVKSAYVVYTTCYIARAHVFCETAMLRKHEYDANAPYSFVVRASAQHAAFMFCTLLHVSLRLSVPAMFVLKSIIRCVPNATARSSIKRFTSVSSTLQKR
jgi:hypothetical protein